MRAILLAGGIIAALAIAAVIGFVLLGRARAENKQLKQSMKKTAQYNEVKHDIEQETQAKLDAISSDITDSFNAGIDLLHDAAKRSH